MDMSTQEKQEAYIDDLFDTMQGGRLSDLLRNKDPTVCARCSTMNELKVMLREKHEAFFENNGKRAYKVVAGRPGVWVSRKNLQVVDMDSSNPNRLVILYKKRRHKAAANIFNVPKDVYDDAAPSTPFAGMRFPAETPRKIHPVQIV